MTSFIPTKSNTSHPLEIPKLIITPSTPTDDTPLLAGRPRLVVPRNQPLLQPRSTPAKQVRVQGSSSAVRTRPPPAKSQQQACALYDQSYRLERSPAPAPRRSQLPTVRESRTRPRGQPRSYDALPLHSRGTTASLILITAAFILVMISFVMNPETLVRIINHQKEWVGDARKSLMAIWELPGGHTQAEWGMTINSFSRKGSEQEVQGQGKEELLEGHKTAGPVMSHDAWKSYLKKRQQMMGKAATGTGPSSHLEAWDFH